MLQRQCDPLFTLKLIENPMHFWIKFNPIKWIILGIFLWFLGSLNIIQLYLAFDEKETQKKLHIINWHLDLNKKSLIDFCLFVMSKKNEKDRWKVFTIMNNVEWNNKTIGYRKYQQVAKHNGVLQFQEILVSFKLQRCVSTIEISISCKVQRCVSIVENISKLWSTKVCFNYKKY